MRSETELLADLRLAVSQELDDSLAQRGFSRSSSSLVFSRTIGESAQEISITADWHPRHQPDAEAHILPTIRVRMPRLGKLALELVQGERALLAGAPDLVVSQPVEFTAPKEAHVRWFASEARGFRAACQSVSAFLGIWVLPLLSEFSTPADLLRCYERADTRVMKQKHWYVFVAAAYLDQGRMDLAREVVRRDFGGAGLRRRYSKLVEAVGA